MTKVDRIVNNCCIGEVSDSTARAFIKEELLKFGEECFKAGREFNSIDGIVDIDVVLPMEFKTDLTPKHITFEEYLKELNNEV